MAENPLPTIVDDPSAILQHHWSALSIPSKQIILLSIRLTLFRQPSNASLGQPAPSASLWSKPNKLMAAIDWQSADWRAGGFGRCYVIWVGILAQLIFYNGFDANRQPSHFWQKSLTPLEQTPFTMVFTDRWKDLVSTLTKVFMYLAENPINQQYHWRVWVHLNAMHRQMLTTKKNGDDVCDWYWADR